MDYKYYRKSIILIIFTVFFLFLNSYYAFAGISAEIVNKASSPEGPVSFNRGNVKVTLSNGESIILPFTTHFSPVVVGDQVFIIATTKNGEASEIIIYNTKNIQSEKYPLPSDINTSNKRYFCSPSFSPDGSKLAYYLVLAGGKGKVIVRSFPDGKLLKRSQTYNLLATDVPPQEPHWQTSQEVEFAEDFFDPPKKVIFKIN
ncbi:hypothetical protein [Desulfobacca acetoxidans]